MSTDWHRRWSEGALGFHKREVHPDLIVYEGRFLGSETHRVLVPLCGKSEDLRWLADRGHEVVGVEIVPQAVEAFFEEQGLDAEVSRVGDLPVHRSGALSLITADIFAVRPRDCGVFDRLWDRAALVALAPDVRPAYASKLKELAAPGALLLQNTFEYDETKMSGPPFSVPDEEVRTHYGRERTELLLERDSIESVPQFAERGHEYWWVRTHLIRL